MSDPRLPSPKDDPSRSPGLLAPLPKRGPGVRRLNRVPIWVFVAGACLVVGATGYTYKVRLQSSAASERATDNAEPASGAAVLNGAPQAGEVQSAARPPPAPPNPAPVPVQQVQAQPPPSDHQRPAQSGDDPAEQARKQAWQTYYQQLAALQQQHQQDALSAMKADTAPNGAGSAGAPGQQAGSPALDGPSAGQPIGAAIPAAYTAGSGLAPGGVGLGASGYPVLPPAAPDPFGAREKQSFINQAGNLGQNDTLAATVRNPISPYLITAGDVIPCVAQGGEDSDTPGQFIGRVSRNIYDSATGRFLLIPQNSKVIGTYDNMVTNGQTRIPTVITRIIFPDSSSIPIGAMPAADQGGFAGLHDQVDTHLWEKFGNALILALGSAGIQLSQGTGQNTNGYKGSPHDLLKIVR